MKTFFGRLLAVLIGLTLFFGGIFLLFMIIGAALGSAEKVVIEPNSILEIKLDEPILESGMEKEVSLFSLGETQPAYLNTLIQSIEKAKEDDDIKAISIHFNMINNEEISQMKNLRDALKDFKESGKSVYAYTNRLDQKGYYLASVADSLFLNPMGTMEFKGLAAEVMFFKNLGEKYGIEFETMRHGKYKSAAEPFFREDLSVENEEQISEVLNGIWDVILTDISADRKLSKQQLNLLADSLVSLIPTEAKNAKLVDDVIHYSDYEAMLKKKLNVEEDEELNLISLMDYAEKNISKFDKNKIAILYASGNITPGDGKTGIQADTYTEAIREIADDDDIKAVVLRINSGGGDANASEEILYEMQKLKKKKPVVVSFGDVAASGGYYIAMANDRLFSEPTTITGSIGVVGMIPNFEKLANNVGVTTDYVKTNENAIIYSPFSGLSPYSKVKMEESIEYIYQQFISHVAKSRNMQIEKVDQLGGGRIYQGNRALQLGLVDEIGGLQDAIKFAAQKAEIEEYQLENYPIRKDDLEEFLEEMNLSAEMKNQLRNTTNPEIWDLYIKIDQLSKTKGVQMLMPYDLEIK